MRTEKTKEVNGAPAPGPAAAPPEQPPQPQAREVRHPLTEAQIAAIKPAMDRIQQLQEMVGMFLGYVQNEQKLPQSVDGWRLDMDPATQKPVIVGHVTDQQ